jgi:ankyrin repeat protein
LLRGHVDVCVLLLQHGADINAVDGLGNTPLHEAAAKNRRDLVEVLLEFGANPGARNKKNMRPDELTRDGVVRKMLETAQATDE